MVSWGNFRTVRPDLEAAGRERFYQFGVGLAFLATVRPDGGPRLHPMCPVIDGDELYAFLIPSPKRSDLHRDGRYAMHSFPADDNEDAFSIRGSATAASRTPASAMRWERGSLRKGSGPSRHPTSMSRNSSRSISSRAC